MRRSLIILGFALTLAVLAITLLVSGTAGLAEVFIVGIKEVPSPSIELPTEQMIGAGQTAAGALKSVMFPRDSITVTPIALFREI